jgi:hypothetical protein
MQGTKGVPQAVFAIALLMVGGVLNIIWGIAAIGNSHFFVGGQHYVFSDLKGWGWITLIIGVLEILASLSLIGGGAYGQWFAIGVGMVAAIGALLEIPAYPLWSIAVFALSLWIIWGLVQYTGPDEYPASSRSGA